ncbi:MAG: DUF116 domain-containing protein [bacterium]|jgi:hypothetical protein
MQGKKRVFLGALLLAVLLVGAVGVLLWYFTFIEPSPVSRRFFLGLALAIFFLVSVVLGGILGIVYSIITGKTNPFFSRPSQIVINHLLPLVIRLGKFFHIAKERVEQSFIEVNNSLVRAQLKGKIKPEQVLILAPHCLQRSQCPHRITTDIYNCQRCGACSINDLLSLAEDYGVKVAVVTGGTLARRIVASIRPRAIVAIACERDLSSGIQDIYPLPALGVVNIRPQGPCFNTQVDPQRVRESVEFFLQV